MNLKFNALYRGGLFLLAACLIWSVWATAQSPTNTNTVAAAARKGLTSATNIVAGDQSLSFGLDRVEALQLDVGGKPLWQYVSFLIYVLLAFICSRFLNFIASAQLKRWAAATKSPFGDVLVSLVQGPIKVTTLVILLHIGLRVISLPEWVDDFVSKGLNVVVSISLTLATLKLVDLLTERWSQRAAHGADRAFDEQLYPIIRKSLRIFVVIVALLMTADHLQLNIRSVIASLSIGGLALGLAAQDTLANLFGAVAVFIDKPFRIGDYVKLDSVEGSVETIGLRSTRLRNPSGYLITVPNKTMGNSTVTNITRRTNIKTEMNIGITYETSVEKIKQAVAILEEIYRAHPMTFDLQVGFNKFDDSSLNINVIHWWNSTDNRAYVAGMQDLNLKIKQRFDEAGIEFAFPSETHYVKSVE